MAENAMAFLRYGNRYERARTPRLIVNFRPKLALTLSFCSGTVISASTCRSRKCNGEGKSPATRWRCRRQGGLQRGLRAGNPRFCQKMAVYVTWPDAAEFFQKQMRETMLRHVRGN